MIYIQVNSKCSKGIRCHTVGHNDLCHTHSSIPVAPPICTLFFCLATAVMLHVAFASVVVTAVDVGAIDNDQVWKVNAGGVLV